MKLYTQYLKERNNIETIELEHCFLTYKKVDATTWYVVDVFVEKDFRLLGLTQILSNLIETAAKENGVTRLLGSIDITANGVTESMAFLLAHGYRFSHANGNGLYFLKLIGE